jgi:hypothetical protein
MRSKEKGTIDRLGRKLNPGFAQSGAKNTPRTISYNGISKPTRQNVTESALLVIRTGGPRRGPTKGDPIVQPSASAFAQNPREVGAFFQGFHETYFPPISTTNLLRPLRRRRANTSRPSLVAILLRKP